MRRKTLGDFNEITEDLDCVDRLKLSFSIRFRSNKSNSRSSEFLHSRHRFQSWRGIAFPDTYIIVAQMTFFYFTIILFLSACFALSCSRKRTLTHMFVICQSSSDYLQVESRMKIIGWNFFVSFLFLSFVMRDNFKNDKKLLEKIFMQERTIIV